jgi:hypothetical protein
MGHNPHGRSPAISDEVKLTHHDSYYRNYFLLQQTSYQANYYSNLIELLIMIAWPAG